MEISPLGSKIVVQLVKAFPQLRMLHLFLPFLVGEFKICFPHGDVVFCPACVHAVLRHGVKINGGIIIMP